MGDAFAKALAALENGQALVLEAPGGTARCPFGSIRMGIFFDGTGNNMWTDLRRENELKARPEGQRALPEGNRDNGATNVVYLYLKYGPRKPPILDKAYHHGVGTDYDNNENPIPVDASLDPTMNDTFDGKPKPQTQDLHGNGLGMARGHGGKARIEWGIRMLAEFYSNYNNDKAQLKFYDVFGFSRGAALARDFVNQVKTQRVPNLNEKVSSSYFSTSYWGSVASTKMEANAEKEHFKPFDPNTVIAKFMGIYDTVSQFGFEAGSFLLDVDHTKVEFCVHFIAEDEFREEFPVTSIFMDPKTARSDRKYQEPRDYSRWFSEMWYPGCHSDIGGSYLDRSGPTRDDKKKGDIKFITLWDMWRAMDKAKVPTEKVDEPTGECIKLYREYCDFRASKDWANHKEQANSRYIHSFATEEYMLRFFGPTPELEMPAVVDMSAAMGAMGGMGGMGMPALVTIPRPARPANPAAANIVPRITNPSYLQLREKYIHDSQTEMALSMAAHENAAARWYFRNAPRANEQGELPRLQRTVLYAAAQPHFSTTVKVRPDLLPPRKR